MGVDENGLGLGTLCLGANGEMNYYNQFLKRVFIKQEAEMAFLPKDYSSVSIEKSIITLSGNNALWS